MKDRKFRQPPTEQTHFANVPSAEIERSTFDRSHGHKTTMGAGRCVPVFVDEVVPGDTFELSSTAFCRLATPLKPIFDNIYLDTHFWYVPYRLVWDRWEEFMGERKHPEDDPTVRTVPRAMIDFSQLLHYTLGNHLGLPHTPTQVESEVSALPFRAYTLIWNEFYRDANFQQPHPSPTNDGPDTFWSTFDCLPRGKRKDYFTSAMPWPQAGDPVYIPLGSTAPVNSDGNGIQLMDAAAGTNSTNYNVRLRHDTNISDFLGISDGPQPPTGSGGAFAIFGRQQVCWQT